MAEEVHEVRHPANVSNVSNSLTRRQIQGASAKEIIIEACRRNNTDLLSETLQGKSEAEASTLLNRTVTVMGNHLYHEAASRGNCTLCHTYFTRFTFFYPY